jgi:hypothetical protein
VNEHKLEKTLERIEQTLQGLSRESEEIRRELAGVTADLDLILALLRPMPTYPKTTGITVQHN